MDLALRKGDADSVGYPRVRPVEKEVKPGHVSVDEPLRLHGLASQGEIVGVEKDVHVARVPHGRLVHGGGPGGDGIAADGRVTHACGVQRL